MSSRVLLILGATVVGLYFSLLVSILAPLHNSTRPMSHDLTLLTRRIPLPNWCKGLRRRSSGPTVALASYPGSGNTWLRYLLQQATGIATGSIYMDHGLRTNGFPAENISDGSVLVVKTHEAPPIDKFQAAVFLIRNPRNALLADFNRRHMGHLGTAPKTAFTKRNKILKMDWLYYVSYQLQKWSNLTKLWLNTYRGPVHIVHYESLVEDTRSTLSSLLSFLNETVSENDMECVLNNKEGIYRRKKKNNSYFDPFTPSMYHELDMAKTVILNMVNEYKAKLNHTRNPFKSI